METDERHGIIAEVIKSARERNAFPHVIRYPSDNIGDDCGIAAISALGQSRRTDFVIDDSNRMAYTQALRWVHADNSMDSISPWDGRTLRGRLDKGLYVAGKTGTGKSWMMELLSAYAMAIRTTVNAGGTIGLLAWQNIRADVICSAVLRGGEEAFENYRTRRVLCIQDLGSEPAEIVFMGTRIDVIRSIIEYRGDRQDLITLFTSNIPLGHKDLSTRYGERVASRLLEMCNYLTLSGTDRRKKYNK